MTLQGLPQGLTIGYVPRISRAHSLDGRPAAASCSRTGGLQMSVQARDLAVEFAYRFGHTPTVSRAPGRVNLIGEHTDYNDGFVMPAALDFATLTAASQRPDRRLRVYSMIMDETREFDLDSAPQAASGDWSDYVLGVALMLERSGRILAGADLIIWSDVPIGAGLSSSAALEVSVAHALLTQSGLEFDPIEIAQICQRAENDFVGMRCGVMDQYMACCGVRHQHAGGEYNLRREACEEGVRLLSRYLGPIKALRDVTPKQLDAKRRKLPDLIYRRCRHIVTENVRVLEAERALNAGDFAACGRAMNASHVSMRDDFEITCPEVDMLAGLAQHVKGVYGSRMTGGGFGGCTVSLIEESAIDKASQILTDGYRIATGLDVDIYVCAPSDGAQLVAV